MADKKEYKELYNMEYYKSSFGTDYTRKDVWKLFFDNIAEYIIKELKPNTVLDMGCAFGYLVEALRNKGVKAYGIDISEYAISQASDSIKPYIKAMSALDELPAHFPKHYDLVISIEMIEHLYEDDGLKVIKKMVFYGDKVLISSTDNDFNEPTHFNVQPKEYWCEKFAEHSFFRNLCSDFTYISQNTYLFEKDVNISIPEIIKRYESVLKIPNQKVNPVRKFIRKLLNTRLFFIKKIIKKIF